MELNVEIEFFQQSGRIVRIDVWGIRRDLAEAVYDQLVGIQETLINLSHEEEIEIQEEKERIRSKYSKRKTAAYNRGMMELLGETEGKTDGKTGKTEQD